MDYAPGMRTLIGRVHDERRTLVADNGIVIGIIELIAVLVMADRCKVDTVAPLIDKLTGAFSKAARKE